MLGPIQASIVPGSVFPCWIVLYVGLWRFSLSRWGRLSFSLLRMIRLGFNPLRFSRSRISCSGFRYKNPENAGMGRMKYFQAKRHLFRPHAHFLSVINEIWALLEYHRVLNYSDALVVLERTTHSLHHNYILCTIWLNIPSLTITTNGFPPTESATTVQKTQKIHNITDWTNRDHKLLSKKPFKKYLLTGKKAVL
jgi:hypothetical protein